MDRENLAGEAINVSHGGTCPVNLHFAPGHMRNPKGQIRGASPFAVFLREKRIHAGLPARIGTSFRVFLPKNHERKPIVPRQLLVNRCEVGLGMILVGGTAPAAARKSVQLAFAHRQCGIIVDSA